MEVKMTMIAMRQARREVRRWMHSSTMNAAAASSAISSATDAATATATETTTNDATGEGKKKRDNKHISFASQFRGKFPNYVKPFRSEEDVKQPWNPTLNQLPNAPPSFLPYKKPIPTGPNRILAPKSYRRRAIAESRAHFMSAEEYARSKFPFPAPVVTKLPLAIRPLEGGDILRMLKKEEIDRVRKEYTSHRDPFVTGDRICVTRYVSLMDKSKVERVYGRVIARRGSEGLTGSFTLRNVKLGEPYEITIPLWAPQIIRIDLLEKGSHKRFSHVKQHWIRKLEPREYETHLRSRIPKFANQVREDFSVEALIEKKKQAKASRK